MPDLKRVPLGPPVLWTEAQLDALTTAESMAQAIPEAAAWWQRNAPAKWRRLLEARPDDAQPNT